MGLSIVDGLNDVFDEVAAESPCGKSVLMLGNLQIPYSKPMLYSFAYNMGISLDYKVMEKDKCMGGVDSRSFFRALGFQEALALDVSDYEGADIIFDLNSGELPENLRERFDYIVDGGTTEHVFDFPRALVNIASMLKAGGKVFHYLPAHNYINHGFYSISPSVLQAFYEGNGFRVRHLNLVLTHRDFWKEPNRFVVDKLDTSFMTNPDYRICNLISAHFTVMPDCIGILRCIAQKTDAAGKIGLPLQTHWYKAQAEREEKLRGMLAVDLDWRSDIRLGIFGIGNITRKFLHIVEGMEGFSREKIKGFFDNDEKRHGNTFEGYPVLPPLEIENLGINVLVIAAARSDAEIYNQVARVCKDGIRIVRMKEYQYML